MKAISFRAKLIGTLLLVILLSVGLVYVLTARSVGRQFSQFTSEQFRRRAQALAPLLVASYYAERGSWEGIDRALGQLPELRPSLGPRQRVLFEVVAWIQEDLVLVDAQGTVVFAGDESLQGRQLPEGVLDQGVPLVYEDRQVGTLLSGIALRRFSPLAQRFLRSLDRGILLAGALAALAALALGGILVRGLARRLDAVTRAAERIAAGQLGQRVEVRSSDEIGRLAGAFNAMSARLQASESLRRQMIADVAHELRTPVSVIQGDLEALVDGVYPPEPKTFQSLLEETRRLSRLIAELRELSLLEAGELSLQRRPLDLAALAAQRLEAFRPQAQQRGIALQVEAEAVPLLEADPDRLSQVLDNLLSNALRYTPRGGRVAVALRGETGGVVCTVTDSGPGIPPEDLEKVFERFWRGDRARSRAGGGSGLGLSIAKRLVEAHGGTMWVQSRLGQGSTFGFRLSL